MKIRVCYTVDISPRELAAFRASAHAGYFKDRTSIRSYLEHEGTSGLEEISSDIEPSYLQDIYGRDETRDAP